MPRVFRRSDRKDGCWWIEYNDEQGTKRREKISPNRRQAEEVLRVRRTEVAERRHLPRKQVVETRFLAFAAEYLAKVVPTLAWAEHCARIVRYWCDYLGDQKLVDVTASQIEQYRVNRLRSVKPSTVNREVAVLKRMFNIARRWDLIENNPVTKLTMLRERNQRLRYLTVEEADRLVAVAAPHLKPLLVLAMNTGARRGELFALRWRDVDLKARIISFVVTKNGRRRDIRLNERARQALLSVPRRGEYVFSATGAPVASAAHSFKTACKRAAIEDFRWHDMRHTFASHAVMNGVDIPTLQQLLGHRSIQMTMRYAHLAPEHAMKAVELVDLGGGPTGQGVREATAAFGTRRRVLAP